MHKIRFRKCFANKGLRILCVGLENRRTGLLFRGFESHLFREFVMTSQWTGNTLVTALAFPLQFESNVSSDGLGRNPSNNKYLQRIANVSEMPSLGRRAGLKIRWGNTRVGSSPTFGTMKPGEQSSGFFFGSVPQDS